MIRPELGAILLGWSNEWLSFDELTYILESAACFIRSNPGPLSKDEFWTINSAIKRQIAMGIMRGDFDGLGVSREFLVECLKGEKI